MRLVGTPKVSTGYRRDKRLQMNDNCVERLLVLSREVGREDRALAILGEGNISVSLDDGTFLIKASGASLSSLAAEQLTQVRGDRIRSVLDKSAVSDAEVQAALMAARVCPEAKIPSVETFLHAVCYAETSCRWIGHCHPTAVLGILCSQLGAAPFREHLYPDAIVVCGPHVAIVPYVDPGLPLAHAVRVELRRFHKQHGTSPKVVLMENHGPVGLGDSDTEVLSLLLTLDKWATILQTTYYLGGPHVLNTSSRDRIVVRPDEQYRRQQIHQ
jgi:rhamnose utilization protein RhaD (predicted bifunctional aldolase and dehydrogenase)